MVDDKEANDKEKSREAYTGVDRRSMTYDESLYYGLERRLGSTETELRVAVLTIDGIVKSLPNSSDLEHKISHDFVQDLVDSKKQEELDYKKFRVDLKHDAVKYIIRAVVVTLMSIAFYASREHILLGLQNLNAPQFIIKFLERN